MLSYNIYILPIDTDKNNKTVKFAKMIGRRQWYVLKNLKNDFLSPSAKSVRASAYVYY